MPATDTWVSDAQATVIEGMNRGREPELIGEQQVHYLRNLSTRGGRARSRPRFVKRLTMPTGILQGAAVFSRTSTVLASVGGRIYEVNPATWSLTEKTTFTGGRVGAPHSADADGDWVFSPLEKEHVLAIYNYRNESNVRTGEYHTMPGDPVLFSPGPGTVSRYHDADLDKDGRIGLSDLTRFLELSSAGEYKALPGTVDGYSAAPVGGPGVVNNPTNPRAWFCETSGSIVVQDGESKPFIYDGATFRRAEDGEVPVGTAMAYGNGRLAVAMGRNVRLGDICKPEHQSELKFTEWSNLTGGGDFAFPEDVRALAVLPVVDTGSGQGSLIVGCSNSTHSLKTQITQRDIWAEVGFQTVVLPTRGIAGANAVVAVNQDIYFRSSDGLRSVRTSTADYDAPGLAPLSVEVRHRFDHDTPFLLEDASLVYFDNRVLCTHSPFVYSSRSLAQGIVALNFDTLSGRGQKTAPVFDGEWDGVVIAQLFTGTVSGTERCFILGRDAAGVNGLWEVLPETAEPVGDSPTQVVETRTLFGSTPDVLKNLRRADLWFSDIRGPLTARVYFRPDKYPFWVKWDEFSVAAPTNTVWARYRPQYRSKLSTRSVPTDTDPFTGRPVSCATGFQIRIEWEGFARLDFLKVAQEPVAGDPSFAENPDAGASATLVTPPAGAVDPTFWYTHPVSPLSGI